MKKITCFVIFVTFMLFSLSLLASNERAHRRHGHGHGGYDRFDNGPGYHGDYNYNRRGGRGFRGRREADSVGRISHLEEVVEHLSEKIDALEKKLVTLENELQKPQQREIKMYCCTLKTNVGGSFVGDGKTENRAKAQAKRKCAEELNKSMHGMGGVLCQNSEEFNCETYIDYKEM